MASAKQVHEWLDKLPDALLVGGDLERDLYYPAIVAVDDEGGRVIYDYNRLVECFAKVFEEDRGTESDDPVLDAIEWIDTNILNGLPYWGEHAPYILCMDDDDRVHDMLADGDVPDRIKTLYQEGCVLVS